MAWNKIKSEARYFGEQDNIQLRSLSWSSIGYFQQQIGKASNLQKIIAAKLADRQPLRGLSLAGGDMTGEYRFLKNAGVTSIDAFDISAGQRDKFFNRMGDSPDIEVNYFIEDVNAISLKENHYDLVYVQQAYHHFEAIE
ncbi:MAG: class I SAM-dependent methyltransferase, partial [Halioglobus sp.]|nr:class I SAM-dependent methyltransferase [Halioglobus sp.]